MRVGIIGTGYVGLVSGVCLADFGHEVTCMDTDESKIVSLRQGKVPIYEPGLADLLERNVYYRRLSFTTDIRKLVQQNQILFISVGTPPQEDGSADLQHVLAVAKSIGQYLDQSDKVIVTKSTVPVGTGEKVVETIRKELKRREKSFSFDYVSNPEFLREGKAVYDFTHPDRVVIGCDTGTAQEIMKELYRVLYINQTPFVFTNIETAEMIKYASNAFLAVKVSFINEMALLAEKVGADIQNIARTMGMDGRISPKFLHAGPGYGGSCFPKDTQAMVGVANTYGIDLKVIQAAIEANRIQKQKMVEKITVNMEDVKDKTIAILGLSFKPETDDLREAPALDIIRGTVRLGASIRTFCPKGIPEARWRLKDIENHIEYCENEYDAAENAHAIVIVTEWNQFRAMDLVKLKEKMIDNYFFDLRNIYSIDMQVRKLFKYFGVGIR